MRIKDYIIPEDILTEKQKIGDVVFTILLFLMGVGYGLLLGGNL